MVFIVLFVFVYVVFRLICFRFEFSFFAASGHVRRTDSLFIVLFEVWVFRLFPKRDGTNDPWSGFGDQ